MEPFSAAAAAISVAGCGFTLATKIHQYVDSVRKASTWLRPVADHVDLTATVLQNLGMLLKKDDIKNLYTAELLQSTHTALNGCENAFKGLDTFVQSCFKKTDKHGRKVLTNTAKFTSIFKQKELDILQAHLERFKSSLDLVLAVLNLASSTRSTKHEDDMQDMKLNILKLVKAEEEAKKHEKVVSGIRDDPPNPPNSLETGRSFLATPGIVPPKIPSSKASAHIGHGSNNIVSCHVKPPWMPSPTPATSITGSTVEIAAGSLKEPTGRVQSQDVNEHFYHEDDAILAQLKLCAEAVSGLASSIANAKRLWLGGKGYEKQCIAPSFQKARFAIQDLSALELDLNFDGDMTYSKISGVEWQQSNRKYTTSAMTAASTRRISGKRNSENKRMPRVVASVSPPKRPNMESRRGPQSHDCWNPQRTAQPVAPVPPSAMSQQEFYRWYQESYKGHQPRHDSAHTPTYPMNGFPPPVLRSNGARAETVVETSNAQQGLRARTRGRAERRSETFTNYSPPDSEVSTESESSEASSESDNTERRRDLRRKRVDRLCAEEDRIRDEVELMSLHQSYQQSSGVGPVYRHSARGSCPPNRIQKYDSSKRRSSPPPAINENEVTWTNPFDNGLPFESAFNTDSSTPNELSVVDDLLRKWTTLNL